MASLAWQIVTCADCGREYQCTPMNDYYHRPEVERPSTTNGVCEGCLLRGANLRATDMRVDVRTIFPPSRPTEDDGGEVW